MLPNGLRKMSSRAIKREVRQYTKKHPMPEEDIQFLSSHPLSVELDTTRKK
jgi:hypothetical protein